MPFKAYTNFIFNKLMLSTFHDKHHLLTLSPSYTEYNCVLCYKTSLHTLTYKTNEAIKKLRTHMFVTNSFS